MCTNPFFQNSTNYLKQSIAISHRLQTICISHICFHICFLTVKCIFQVRSDLWRSSGPSTCSNRASQSHDPAQDHIQVTFEYLQQSRISFDTMCQGLGALTGKKCFLVLKFVPLALSPLNPLFRHLYISEILPEPALLQLSSNVPIFTQQNAQ